jgi:CubicO group peptidase (beta-lactamase class C family)
MSCRNWPKVWLVTALLMGQMPVARSSPSDWQLNAPLDSLASVSAMRIREGQITQSYYQGFRVLDESESKPVNENSLFRIASVSKLVTAIGFMPSVKQTRDRMKRLSFFPTIPHQGLLCI